MVIKRVRDKLRNFRPQEVVSYEDWVDIENRFIFASTLLKDDNPAYLILKTDLEEAREILIHNRIHEVREVRIIGEIQKIFTTDKKEQMDELVGQVKYIEGYLAELQSWIQRKVHLEHEEANGKIVIRRNPEEAVND
jgi:hypothetical protein